MTCGLTAMELHARMRELEAELVLIERAEKAEADLHAEQVAAIALACRLQARVTELEIALRYEAREHVRTKLRQKEVSP